VSESAEDLAAQLSAAHAAASALAGREPLGLRAVEPASGRRWYLCAFEGPSFLCLAGGLQAEPSERRARQAAAASLLVERAEQLVDADALRDLARAVGRALAHGAEGDDLAEALGEVAQEALELAAWREAPERALASLPELEAGGRRHERLRAAYGRFVTASDPLVAVQDTLPPALVEALRGLEEAAGAAGVGESLAQRLGAALPDCDEGAGQVVALHLTRLA